MEQAYSHLADLGHERIGLILGPARPRALAAQARVVERVAKLATASELVERTRFSLEGGHAAATRLIEHGVTGIICASDPLALGAIRAGPPGGPLGAQRPLGDRLRRLGAHELHQPAAHDRPPAARGDQAAPLSRYSWGRSRAPPVSAEELFFEPEMVARARPRTRPDVETASLALNRPKITVATVPLCINLSGV